MIHQITFASDEQVDDYKIMLERYLEKNKYSDVEIIKFFITGLLRKIIMFIFTVC